MPDHRRDGLHRRPPGRAAGAARATRCAASRARAATPRALERARRRARRAATSRDPRSLARAAAGCATSCTAPRWSPTGRRSRRSRGERARARATCSQPRAGAARAALRAHLSTTDVYGHPGAARGRRGRTPRRGFAQLVRADQARRRGEVLRAAPRERSRDRRSCARRPSTGPARAEVDRRDRRGDPRPPHAADRPRRRDRRASATSRTCIDAVLLALDEPAARGRGVQRQRRARRELAALHRGPRRGPRLPRRRASASPTGRPPRSPSRSSTATALLRGPPALQHPAAALPPGRAGARPRPGLQQRSGARALGWEPRVGYAEGLAATLEWLREERPAAA